MDRSSESAFFWGHPVYYLSSLVMASSVGAKTVKCPVGSSNRGSKPDGNDIRIIDVVGKLK